MADDINEFIAKAIDIGRALLAQGLEAGGQGAQVIVGQTQEAASDLLANREALRSMIRSEVDRAVGRMGFVREDELAAVRRHVERLERQVAEIRDQGAGGPAQPAAAATKAPVRKAQAKKAPATKASARKAPAKRVPAAKPPARRTPVTKASASAKATR